MSCISQPPWIIFFLLRGLHKRRLVSNNSSAEFVEPGDSSKFLILYNLACPCNTNRTQITPRSPTPAFASEIYKLGTSVTAGYGGGHGLDFDNLQILQKADTPGDMPNPCPAQRVGKEEI